MKHSSGLMLRLGWCAELACRDNWIILGGGRGRGWRMRGLEAELHTPRKMNFQSLINVRVGCVQSLLSALFKHSRRRERKWGGA